MKELVIDKPSELGTEEEANNIQITVESSESRSPTSHLPMIQALGKPEPEPKNVMVLRNIEMAKSFNRGLNEAMKKKYKQKWLAPADCPAQQHGSQQLFQTNLLDPEMVRQYWTKELDRQLRGTKFLKESAVGQLYAHGDEGEAKSNSSDDSDAAIDHLRGSRRAKYEEALRAALRQKIEDFI